MSLTNRDLQNIENIVDKVVDRKTKNFATKDDLSSVTNSIEVRIGKMESRIVAAMGLLQRDTFTGLEDHENRISRLEKKLSNS